MRLDEAGDRRKEAEIAIDKELEAQDVDADPARRFRIAAKGIDLAADARAGSSESA